MFAIQKQWERLLNEGAFILPLMILLVSIVAGIILSQLFFSRLRKVAARIAGDS